MLPRTCVGDPFSRAVMPLVAVAGTMRDKPVVILVVLCRWLSPQFVSLFGHRHRANCEEKY